MREREGRREKGKGRRLCLVGTGSAAAEVRRFPSGLDER